MSIAMSPPAAPRQHSTTMPQTPEKAPRGQREVKDVTYGDWKKLCFKPGGAKMLCRTSIAGTFATGQLAIRLDIIERQGDNVRRLQVFSPVGMYLQNPVKLTIDQGKSHRVPYTWCLTNVCIAGAVAPSTLIEAMMTGRVLRLEFVESNLLALTTSLPLDGFAAIYTSNPTPTFEQDIDE
jgi:invasion protein IalB